MCKNTVRKQNSNSWSCLLTLSVCKESAPGYVKGTVEDKICKICRHLESLKHVLDSVNMFNLSVLYYALACFACRAVCDLYSNKVLLGSCIYFIQIRVNKQTLPVPHFLYMYNHVHMFEFAKWHFVCLLLICRCDLGCCLIPCLIDDLKDVTHTCPYCKGYIYTYKRIC